MNINLSRAKDDKGNLCFVMIDDNEEVFVFVEDYKEAKQLGIHYTRINIMRRRVDDTRKTTLESMTNVKV